MKADKVREMSVDELEKKADKRRHIRRSTIYSVSSIPNI